MERHSLDLEQFKRNSFKNQKVRREYDRLQPEFALIKAILHARKEKGMTQKELADKMGSRQAVISRLETGRANPSLEFIKKLAKALGASLEIRLVSS
jgi:ribosome-binding protein aMBF1 (putative translation factor)